MSAALEHLYRYPFESTLDTRADAPRLRLAASNPEAEVPAFFEGGLLAPRIAARTLRATATLAATRFHTPPAMLVRILREADPVVTCGAGFLRFESFSACAGAYARADLGPEALRVEESAPGVVNVDFGAAMRAALAQVRDGHEVGLSVTPAGLRAAVGGGGILEKKVRLPVRWLRGFVEVQTSMARMELRHRVSGAEALRFLRRLPRRHGRGLLYVVASGPGLRLAATPDPAAVPLHGPERLRLLEELAPDARQLTVWADPATGASAWSLDLGTSSWTLALSPETWRGFSGEGGALAQLADPDRDALLARLRAALAWDPVVPVADLAPRLGAEPAAVLAGLAGLGALGLVGYDLVRQAWFHRPLPFERARIEELHPRLLAARRLVAEGRVRLLARDPAVEAEVEGSEVVHRVVLDAAGDRCTCPWHGQHQGSRGPCKHILAAGLAAEAEEAPP